MKMLQGTFAAAAFVVLLAGAAGPVRADTAGLVQADAALRDGHAEHALMLLAGEMERPVQPVANRARALYLRAKALLAAGRPALAAADVNAALWLNALTAGDAADAELIRAETAGAVVPEPAVIAPVAPLPIEAAVKTRPVS